MRKKLGEEEDCIEESSESFTVEDCMAVKMEDVRAFETSTSKYKSTGRHITYGMDLFSLPCENTKRDCSLAFEWFHL